MLEYLTRVVDNIPNNTTTTSTTTTTPTTINPNNTSLTVINNATDFDKLKTQTSLLNG